MDSEFIKRCEKIRILVKQKEMATVNYSVLFSDDEDGLIKIIGKKGEFIYKLKELDELYAPEEIISPDIDWDDEYYLSLLFSIESAIKRVYDDKPDLTDASAIYALEKLSLKPEAKEDNIVIREINQQLRVQLSMSDYSRTEVKRAIRKIRGSAKRHTKIDGIRGYLDFIAEYVP